MIKIGDIYRIRMYKGDGITPKGDDEYWAKYIIVIGHDGGNYYGVVVTNTCDHRLVPIEFQYPLNDGGYKCYVNCYDLRQVSKKRLTRECYKSSVSEDDIRLIIECLKGSPAVSKKTLKKFGLLE